MTAAAARGIVLAGGAGSRLGVNKPSAPLAGRPLIEYPIDALHAAGLAVTVLAKSGSSLPPFEPPRYAGDRAVAVAIEPQEPRHPLRGIVSALEAYRNAPVVVVACDMPFVSAELIAWLATLDDAAAAVPEYAGRLHPMLGRYTPDALAALSECLREQGSVASAVEKAGLRRITDVELARFGDPGRLLFDVDTPADLERAEQMFA